VVGRLVVAAAVVALTFRTAPLDPPYQAVEPGPFPVRDGPLAAVARAGVVGAFVVVLLSLLVYDAARTIAAFSARLREQVDLDTLSAELLAVTHQTMRPTTASLWLRARP
jgi:hypothetical protein